MILVIENIHQISIKWMDVIQLGEIRENLGEPVMIILLSKFDFSHVKMSNAMNLVMLVNNCWSLSLSL